MKKLRVFQHFSDIVADVQQFARVSKFLSKLSQVLSRVSEFIFKNRLSSMLNKMLVFQHFPKIFADVQVFSRVSILLWKLSQILEKMLVFQHFSEIFADLEENERLQHFRNCQFFHPHSFKQENSGSFGTIHCNCLRPANAGSLGTTRPGSTVSSDSATGAPERAFYVLPSNCFRQKQSIPLRHSTTDDTNLLRPCTRRTIIPKRSGQDNPGHRVSWKKLG